MISMGGFVKMETRDGLKFARGLKSDFGAKTFSTVLCFARLASRRCKPMQGGPSVAAQLVALKGRLPQLAKMPTCNLQVLGQVKHSANSHAAVMIRATNNSTNQQHQHLHQGILAQRDLVQRCPRAMRHKALKLAAAKLALSVRHDHIHVDTGRPRSAATGRQFRQQIEQKLVQIQEPDKAPVLKALPKPDLTAKKRRGGKRMRRLKERCEETTRALFPRRPASTVTTPLARHWDCSTRPKLRQGALSAKHGRKAQNQVCQHQGFAQKSGADATIDECEWAGIDHGLCARAGCRTGRPRRQQGPRERGQSQVVQRQREL